MLRLWTIERLRRAFDDSGVFRLAAIYGDGPGFDEVPLDTHIIGEMYNHYYVLEALGAS